MMGATICALSDAAAMPILGFINKFPEYFDQYIREAQQAHREGKTLHATH